MGTTSSLLIKNNNCNYNCTVCKASGKVPNMNGRFFLINDTQCQCNGCNTIFEKDLFYATPIHRNFLDGKWAVGGTNPDNSTETETVPQT